MPEKYELVGSNLVAHLTTLGIKHSVKATDTFMYIYVTNSDDKAKCPDYFENFRTIIRVVDPKRLPKY